MDTLYATHDDIDSFTIRVQVNGKDKTYSWPYEKTAPPPGKPLVLIYAVLDNNLDSGWDLLVNNIERGVHDDADVRLMVDALGLDNALVYEPVHDENSLCPNAFDRRCGYVNGQNVWSFDTENTAHPAALPKFISDSLLNLPIPNG